MVEIDNIVNEETEVEQNTVSNDGVEPEIKQTIEKKKKPRSAAQIAAFEKAIAKRKSNLEAKKKVKIQEKKPEIKEEMVKINTPSENAFPSTQTGFHPLDIDLKAWIEQDTTPEPEPEVEDDEEDEDYQDEEEDSSEEEIIVKKKPKTVKAKPIPIPKKKPIEKKKKPKKPKIVYISDSGTDDEPEAPAKDPLDGMDFRSRARLRGF
jgi:hypothetical protein